MVDGDFDVTYPVLGIIGAVLIRYCVVSFARFSVRRVALLKVSYDLRQAFFNKLQQQGSEFFSQFSIGDMMTRAVADISLIQRLISMGTILLIIMVYATVVGFGFMLYYSPWLTLLLLPPMPLVFSTPNIRPRPWAKRLPKYRTGYRIWAPTPKKICQASAQFRPWCRKRTR